MRIVLFFFSFSSLCCSEQVEYFLLRFCKNVGELKHGHKNGSFDHFCSFVEVALYMGEFAPQRHFHFVANNSGTEQVYFEDYMDAAYARCKDDYGGRLAWLDTKVSLVQLIFSRFPSQLDFATRRRLMLSWHLKFLSF